VPSQTLTIGRRGLLRAAGLAGAAVATGVGVPSAAGAATSFAHPGMLHTAADFARIKTKLAASDATVTAGLQRLTANGRSQSTWRPRPVATVVRGGAAQNYVQFYLDVHAAYQNALRWRITGETAHADTARDILNAWTGMLTAVNGNADRFLAAGIYGYQFANAAELMRGYDGFDVARAQDMLKRVFYPVNDSFLVKHNDACISNYWANWDLCTMASVMAIGILCDDRAMFDRAVDYFKTGAGNGAIKNAVPFLYDGGLGQWQESGRDQGHTVMGIGLMSTICEMAHNQGVDLYGFDNNRFLAGAEYVARYNLGKDVPFTTYQWGTGQNCARREQTVISGGSRGQMRPVWEMVYNHYVQRQGLSAPNVTAMAAQARAEGGGGDYGPNSGGYDQLGFGTLLFTRDRTASATPSSSPTPVSKSRTVYVNPAGGAQPTSSLGSAIPPVHRGGGAPAGPFDLAAQRAGEGGAGAIAGLAGGIALVTAGAATLAVRLRRRRAQQSGGPTS